MRPASVDCPICAMHWSIETRHSWWLTYDRCYGCMGDATGIVERVLTDAEAERFQTYGQLSLLEA